MQCCYDVFFTDCNNTNDKEFDFRYVLIFNSNMFMILNVIGPFSRLGHEVQSTFSFMFIPVLNLYKLKMNGCQPCKADLRAT